MNTTGLEAPVESEPERTKDALEHPPVRLLLIVEKLQAPLGFIVVGDLVGELTHTSPIQKPMAAPMMNTQ